MRRGSTGRGRVLVIEDDPTLVTLVDHWLRQAGFATGACATAERAWSAIAAAPPDAVLLDLGLPDLHGMEVLRRIVASHPDLPVVMMTGTSDVDMVVEAMKLGACDYVTKPVSRDKLLTALANAMGRAGSIPSIDGSSLDEPAPPGFVGRSEAMLALYGRMNRLAPRDVRVLIRGETGTGKELVAGGLHAGSPRSKGPFVALNCAAIPTSLQESELFGHEAGAFTGARGQRAGRLEQAHGGVLFLDEVAELTPALQAQLLRALQEQRFFRVGGSEEVQVDCRVLAATNADLEGTVRSGAFRKDLYFRLAVVELKVPPLRHRLGDIPRLVDHFGGAIARREGQAPPVFLPEAMAALEAYTWPGNVRELQNALETALALGAHPIRAADLPDFVREATTGHARTPSAGPTRELAEVERQALLQALDRYQGNVAAVVRALGTSRSTVYRRLKAYGVR